MGKAVTGRMMPEIPGCLTETETLNFKYLQAVYSLNMFYGLRLDSKGHFETKDEKICSETIKRGGNIVDMCRSGADPLYCALLSDPLTDVCLLVKAVELFIPF